jgi:hypothetical protein
MPLGAALAAQRSNFWNQGPNYFNSRTFAMTMVLDPTPQPFVSYSLQNNNSPSQTTGQWSNLNYAWTAGTVDTTNRADWDQEEWTIIHTYRFPQAMIDDLYPAGSGNQYTTFWGLDVDANAAGTHSFNHKLGADTNRDMLWETTESGGTYESGVYFYVPGTTTKVNVVTALQDRWVSWCMSRGPISGFSNWTGNSTYTYGVRIVIADAVTGEILGKADVGSLNVLGTIPDYTAYATMKSGPSSAPAGEATFRYTALLSMYGDGWTGAIDVSASWIALGTQTDGLTTPAVWIGSQIPLTISGAPAWLFFDGRTSPVSSGTFGETTVATATGSLVSQTNSKEWLGGISGGQFGFTNTIYPGS